MFEMLKRLFGSRPAPLKTQIDPQVAAAALFAEAALTDGIYADIEGERVLVILMDAFDLDQDQARTVMEAGEAAAEEAIDAYRFTSQVKLLPEVQRDKVIEGLYYIALADGERCVFEDAFIRHVASLLHVEDVRRAGARQRAEARHASD